MAKMGEPTSTKSQIFRSDWGRGKNMKETIVAKLTAVSTAAHITEVEATA